MSHIIAACASCLAALLPSVHSEAPADQPATVEAMLPGAADALSISPEEMRGWIEWLQANDFSVDRCGIDPERGVVTIDLTDDVQRHRLIDSGFTIIHELDGAPLEGGVRTQSQYFDPTEIAAMLNAAATNHPNIARVFTIGTTHENRSIYALEISDQPGVTEDEPAIQFNGQHHAREVATSHVVIDVVDTLINGYGVDSEVTAWVNNYKTICVPMVNPDGVQHVFNGTSSWRKNRSANGCVGVDLNRNYQYRWGPAGCGSGDLCSDITYRGPIAASELETQAMRTLADQWHFVMATSYHSFGQFIDYPYACYNGNPSGQMPEHLVIADMMVGMRDGIVAAGGPSYTVYTSQSAGPLSGDDTSWYYAYKGTYPFIVEIGQAFEPMPFTLVPPMINYLRGGWKYLYRRLGQARIDVHVTDACNDSPIEATVTLTNYVYDTGELPRATFLPYGRWTYIVRPNFTYTVRVSKPGYTTQDVPVFVANAPQPLAIALESTAPPVFGDTDCDGDVDQADTEVFVPCIGGPSISISGQCKPFDSDSDNDVDLKDAAAFLSAFTG